jgi:hypothetical protein
MNVLLWASELAAVFWDAAGGPERFPRTLQGPILDGRLDLTVKELPALCVGTARHYLAEQGVAWACAGPERRLRACLAAGDGAGFILLDGNDPPAERVFSLAHELAHFLRHNLQPRRRAGRRLGQALVEVIDGRRPPSPAERLRALLAHVHLGLCWHLMERGDRQEITRPEVAAAEEEADQLAFELLAPATAVLQRTGHADGEPGWALVAAVLEEVFGLPPAAAAKYASRLVPPRLQDSLLRRLGRP